MFCWFWLCRRVQSLLKTRYITNTSHLVAFNMFSALCDPVTLTFDLLTYIIWWARMDYE